MKPQEQEIQLFKTYTLNGKAFGLRQIRSGYILDYGDMFIGYTLGNTIGKTEAKGEVLSFKIYKRNGKYTLSFKSKRRRLVLREN